MDQNRRRFLAAVSAGLTGMFAGCGGDGGTEQPTADPTATETATPTPEPTPTPTETPTQTTEPTPTATETPAPTETATPLPEVAQTVLVGPGAFVFEPETFSIAAGETVRWEWASNFHNVKPASTPSESDWTGTPGDASQTYNEGYTYSYTFDVAGEYDYYCNPHRSAGMTGSFTVTE